MSLSIIVPIFNEGENLPSFLSHLAKFKNHVHEIIFVDGGSDDNSVELISRAGFMVLRSERGRAAQMNCGAKAAQGSVYIFLHADTYLPENAMTHITRALQKKHWGRFNVCISGKSWMLPVVAFMMNLRSWYTGIATGDQTIFVRRDVFLLHNGFPLQPLMEDIALSVKLRAHSRPVCLKACVRTSGRRWESQGVWSTIILMWKLRWMYWRGVPVAEIASHYQELRCKNDKDENNIK